MVFLLRFGYSSLHCVNVFRVITAFVFFLLCRRRWLLLEDALEKERQDKAKLEKKMQEFEKLKEVGSSPSPSNLFMSSSYVLDSVFASVILLSFIVFFVDKRRLG